MPRRPNPIDANEPGSKKESVSFPRPMAIAIREHVGKSKRKYASVSHYLQTLVERDIGHELPKVPSDVSSAPGPAGTSDTPVASQKPSAASISPKRKTRPEKGE